MGREGEGRLYHDMIPSDDKAVAPPPPPVTPACQHTHSVGDAALACGPSLDTHFTKDDWFAMIQWAGKHQPPSDLVADVDSWKTFVAMVCMTVLLISTLS